MLKHALIWGAYLFSISIYGLIISWNMVRALMCLELILNAANVNLITFSNYFDSWQVKGDIFLIFVTTIATVEAAIGLAIALVIYHNIKSTCIN